jgi:3,4-dihydroxy 2-butanone 4-phosphate synthase/GTP cyclohydrolase II
MNFAPHLLINHIVTSALQMITARAKAHIKNPYGDWTVIAFSEEEDTYSPHLAIINREQPLNKEKSILVRIHSECITGDVFSSRRCDCGEQLAYAMEKIGNEGGLLIYLRQEGRGIGIINKLKAYGLQDKGIDTYVANEMLGHKKDERSYETAIAILEKLGIKKIKLLTNNPEKINAFVDGSIELTERIPIIIEPNDENQKYLESKMKYMGHLLDPHD